MPFKPGKPVAPIGAGGAAPPNSLPIPSSKPFQKPPVKKGGKGK